MTNIDFEPIVIKSKSLKGLSVELHWDCYEGVSGEYDCEDKNDIPLLRFDVLLNGEQVDNGSYCTNLSVNDNRDLLIRATQAILKEAENSLNCGFKRAMEFMSWIEIVNGELK